ncbi:hypothetical protein TNCV_1268001 [Trichonephila clavipes]|nr:hypothetical protein TNCV_1268001 [Trichonephila clavipes]
MVSADGQQRLAPLRHGVNEAINHELEYSVPLFQKSSSSSWRVYEGGWRPATRLPRASQTCSIGFMSENTLTIPFARLLPQKRNPPPG